MARSSESGLRAPLLAAAVTVVALVTFFLWWRRPDPPKIVPKAEATQAEAAKEEPREHRGYTPADPEKARAARKARDEMRERIVAALRKRTPAPAAAPAAGNAPAAARTGSAKEDLPKGSYEPAYIQKHVREDLFPLVR